MTKIVENVFIPIFVLLIIGLLVWFIVGSINGSIPCYSSQSRNYECLKYNYDKCIADEYFTKEDCLRILGNGD